MPLVPPFMKSPKPPVAAVSKDETAIVLPVTTTCEPSVAVGTPPQYFEVLPALQSQNLWIPIADECSRLQNGSSTCGTSRGVLPFAQRPSPGFQSIASSSWETIGLYELGPGRNWGITGNGLTGFDDVHLNNATLEHVPVTAYAAPGFWIGQIGLLPLPQQFSDENRLPSLLETLKQEGHIPSLSYGYQVGAAYRDTGVPGSLVLGGYDEARASLPLTLKMNADLTRALTVAIQDIVVTSTLNGTLSLVGTERVVAPIDSSLTDIWLPQSICDKFELAFGLLFEETSGRYVLTDAARDVLRQRGPTITFTIGASPIAGANNTIIRLPYAAFDLQASFPIFTNATNYFPIRRAANESQFAIGRTLLQEAYLSADFEFKVFNLSAANWDGRGANIIRIPASNETSIKSPRPDHGLPTGTVAGIAVGVLAAIAMLIAAVWVIRVRRAAITVPDAIDSKIRQDSFAYPTTPELKGFQICEMPACHGHSELRSQNLVPELPSPQRIHEAPVS
ncbi:hypothetical protein NX059_004559 [Plenodomus lindquistii]|nr:hypothetical protein NX059_004559 [Plenodomus lindquistii]